MSSTLWSIVPLLFFIFLVNRFEFAQKLGAKKNILCIDHSTPVFSNWSYIKTDANIFLFYSFIVDQMW